MNPIKTIKDIIKFLPVVTTSAAQRADIRACINVYAEDNKILSQYRDNIRNHNTRDHFDIIIRELNNNKTVREIANITGMAAPTLYRLVKDIEINDILQYTRPRIAQISSRQLKYYEKYMHNYYNTIKLNNSSDSIAYTNGARAALDNIYDFGINYSIYHFMKKIAPSGSTNYIEGYTHALNNIIAKVQMEEEDIII